MKYRLVITFCALLYFVSCNCSLAADFEKPVNNALSTIKSSHANSYEIPIILDKMDFKEFTINNNDDDEFNYMEDYKPLNLLSNKDIMMNKGSLASNSEFKYHKNRVELLTRLY